MQENYHQDLNTVRVNTMPDRAFYIPSCPGAPTAEKEDNDSFTDMTAISM